MILCCGEALIDMIPQATVAGADGFVPHPGGAVFNTARALGRLGVDVGMFTGLSHDMFGDVLQTALAESRVQTGTIYFSDRPSTLAFVTLQNGQARYSFFDENSAGRMLGLADLPPEPLAAKTLFFGGISLVAEPAADAYAALLRREAGRKLIMLDPNIRPSFITDPVSYRSRLDQMISQSDIVKISDEDLSWLFPEGEDLNAKVDEILAAGVTLVLLTQGSEGATAFRQDHDQIHVAAQRVTVVDTVGAGDAFNAGFLARLDHLGYAQADRFAATPHETLTQCLEFAMRVAGHTVTQAGANPPWAHQV